MVFWDHKHGMIFPDNKERKKLMKAPHRLLTATRVSALLAALTIAYPLGAEHEGIAFEGHLIPTDVASERELNEALVNPPQDIKKFVNHLEKVSTPEELTMRLSILAGRLWETRRYDESLEVSELTIEKLENESLRPGKSNRDRASLKHRIALLKKKTYQDQTRSRQLLKEAMALDPDNEKIAQEVRRADPKPILINPRILDYEEENSIPEVEQ